MNNNIKSLISLSGLLLTCISGYSQSSGNNIYKKLFAELEKYAVVYDKYSDANYPILSGNAAIGGLMDPLGRGVYNIEVNDLYLNEKERCIGPGMMLNMAQFAGLQPKEYRQSYDLESGILSTHIAYSTGAYHSELFFSQDDKELMVYTLTNLGKDDLLCNIDLGRYLLKFAGQSSSSLYLISPDGSFSCLHYFLRSNMNLNTHLPYSQDVYVNVPSDNGDAIAFAHENLFDRSNHQVPPWDKQVHIQGFAPAMYYHYNRLYAEKEDTTYAVMRAAALAEQRKTDCGLRKQWLQIAQNIRIKDRNDVYLEFDGDDGSRAGAGYQGIRGYAYLGFPTLETMKSFAAKKVNKSLDLCWERNKKGDGMITFIANWFALTDAYWGRAEEAYEKSSYCLTQTDPSCSAMCEQNGALYYFLTGYASFTMVPVSMVLQSVGNEIKVFPAVPKAFNDIEFYNLPATGNIRVSGIMKGGKAQKVRFEKDGKILLEIKDKDRINVSVVDGRLKEIKNSVTI